MRKIALPEQGTESLFGSYDENLKHLESLFNVRIRTSGQELVVEGDCGRRRARRAGARPAGAHWCAAATSSRRATCAPPRSWWPRTKRSIWPTTSCARAADLGQAPGAAKSVNQRNISTPSSSTTSCSASARPGPARPTWRWRRPSRSCCERVNRIVLARPAVEAGEKLGFLPGDLQEKVNPYLRPLYDALYDMLDVERVERLLERGTIEVAPIAFMRGRTLNDAFVILDEAQNTTSEQMKMFLTRLGFGSKAVITGDITQIDLPTGRTSGLVEAMKVVGGIDGIAFIHFDDKDVVRHQLVQQIVKAYESYGGSRQ